MYTTESQLFRWGIPTYIQTIFVDLTSTAEIKISDTLPTQMGWIYGLNTYADGTDTDGTTLISTANCLNLWWKIVQGDVNFIQKLRFSDLLYNVTNQGFRYYEVNIPGTISLDQSLILNPTKITGVRLLMQMHYIRLTDLVDLVYSKKVVMDNGFIRKIKS